MSTGSKIYQPKIKCKDGGSYFYKNQNYRRLEIISFQKFLNFHLRGFSENAQYFVRIFRPLK